MFGQGENGDCCREDQRVTCTSVKGAEEQLAQPGTQDLLRVLNRKTTCVAIGLLGAVFFAALVLPFQERHSKIDELTKEESKITGDFVPHVNPAAITDVPSSNEKRTHENCIRKGDEFRQWINSCDQ